MSNISELKFDDKNFNKHTEFGMSLLEKSLQEDGAGRSILIDKDNNIIAGNGIIEAAGQAGLENVKIVETTGDEIVAVKRTDVSLNTKEGREMALADNATAAADLDWDEDLLKDSFSEDELKKWNVDVKWNDDDILAKYDDAESGWYENTEWRDDDDINKNENIALSKLDYYLNKTIDKDDAFDALFECETEVYENNIEMNVAKK